MAPLALYLLAVWFLLAAVGSAEVSNGEAPIQYKSYHDLDAFELVREGNSEVLEQLLALKEIDVNRREASGKTLLHYAAEKGQAVVVDVLLQFGAKVELRDRSTGSTCLLAAVTAEDAEITMLLLGHNASPDDRNSAGVSARSLATEKKYGELLTLMDEFDASGPVAFEDRPGTWLVFSEGNRKYYQNADTQESRWSVPTSCAWLRQSKQGIYVYYNFVTKQVIWTRPDSLCWKFIVNKNQERPMWFNYRTKHMQAEVPGELPGELVGELMDEGSTFWFNEASGDMAWEEPKEISWRKVVDERGGVFWFNQRTGLSQWDDPVDMAWREEFSQKEKKHYYWNEYTGEAAFGKPEPIAWTMKKEL